MQVKPRVEFSAVFLLLCVAGGVWLWQSDVLQPGRLPISVVEIEGDFHHLDRTAVQQKVAQAIVGEGFFTLDMFKLRQQVLALPWVAQVSVQRRWPDALRIHVTEQVAIARWGEDALVNIQGDIFHPEKVPVLAMPVLQAMDTAAPRVVGLYSRLNAQFNALDLRIRQLVLNAREEWIVHFSNGLALLLGQHHLQQRVHDFLRVYPQLLANNPQRVDMRYEQGFAVRWQATESNNNG